MRRSTNAFYATLMHLTLVVGCLVTLLPLFWMVTGSFKTMAEITKIPMVVFPGSLSPVNYADVFRQAPFGLYYLNSLVVAVISTVSIVLTSVAAGYSLAKFRFRGRNAIFLVFIGSMMVPFYIRMIPLYGITLRLHLMDRLSGVIFIALMDCFGIFMMRQFIMDIPSAYLESGRMEGASEPRILVGIVLPMCKPALSALTILTFLGDWEWYLWPVIVLTSTRRYTLPIGLASFAGRYMTYFNRQMAAATLVTVPVILLFVLFQRRFVEGVAMTGVKG